MEEYYAHTIKPSGFTSSDIYRLDDILRHGYIFSRRNLRYYVDDCSITSEETSLFNGLDYISLCDLKKDHSGYSSYNSYTRNGLSLLIDHSIDVITPTLIDRNIYNYYNVKTLDLINNQYTDFKDEVQAKDKISLEYLRGLTIPLSSFFVTYTDDYLKYYVNYIESLLQEYHYPVPIYNLDTWEKIKVKK
jgi:hypothetical protein